MLRQNPAQWSRNQNNSKQENIRSTKTQMPKSYIQCLPFFCHKEFSQLFDVFWCLSALFRFSPWMRMASKGHKALTPPLTTINFCANHIHKSEHKGLRAQIQTGLLFGRKSLRITFVCSSNCRLRIEGFNLICSRVFPRLLKRGGWGVGGEKTCGYY